MIYNDLVDYCRVRGFRVALAIVDVTNRPIRHEGSAVGGSLQLRVLTRERELIGGRIQSEPGRESLDQLAAGCVATLRKKGVLQ